MAARQGRWYLSDPRMEQALQEYLADGRTLTELAAHYGIQISRFMRGIAALAWHTDRDEAYRHAVYKHVWGAKTVALRKETQ